MSNNVYLVLGCNGRVDGGFVSCSKVENQILELSEKLEKIDEIVVYLKALSLFQRPNKDYNAIRHILFNMKDKYYQGFKPIWDDKYFHLLEKFTLAHRDCGIYLKIVMIESDAANNM